jgi:DNA-binding MarR family transcriptional regulator
MTGRQPAKNHTDIPDKARLRLWIKLLRTSRAIEAEVRDRLRRQFSVTLARFDIMAALYRKPHGMMMSELSRHLMVSNGNVTGLVDRMIHDGIAIRSQRDGDRRSWFICLTKTGSKNFAEMAKAHEQWIDELLAGVDQQQAWQLHNMLARLDMVQGTKK